MGYVHGILAALVNIYESSDSENHSITYLPRRRQNCQPALNANDVFNYLHKRIIWYFYYVRLTVS